MMASELTRIEESLFCFIFLAFFWFVFLMACKILIPQPGIEPGPQAVRLPSPNHLTAREFLIPYLSMKVKVLVTQSGLTLCDPMDTDLQASLSMGFLRQEYCSGLPFPSPGNLFDPGIDPGLPHCWQIVYTWKHQGSPPFYRCHQLEIHLIEHLLFERWSLMGVGRKVGEGWILNPCFIWVNMNYLKRESDQSLRRHSGNPHWERKKRGHFQSQGNQDRGTTCIIHTHWKNICLGGWSSQLPLDSVYLPGFFQFSLICPCIPHLPALNLQSWEMWNGDRKIYLLRVIL